LEVAKGLVQGKDYEAWSWGKLELAVQDEALDRVIELLDKQGISVSRNTIETRLQNAIKDWKASMCSINSALLLVY
jgi:hypothetical protein